VLLLSMQAKRRIIIIQVKKKVHGHLIFFSVMMRWMEYSQERVY